MIINKSGVAIRMGLDELRVMGRNTQGVRLINLKNGDAIAAVAKVTMDKEVEESEDAGELDGENTSEVNETPQDQTNNNEE